MLTAADAELVARDRTLPGLATVLDPHALRDWLRGVVDIDVDAVTPRYVRYKPRTSCLVAVSVSSGALVLDGYAKAHSRSDAAKAAKPGQWAVSPHPSVPGAVSRPDAALAFVFSPNDRRLPALPRVADGAFLPRLLPQRPDLWTGTVSQLRHKPERRWVGRLAQGARPQGLLKCYCPEDFPRAHAGARLAKHIPAPRVPQLLGAYRRRGVLALSWLPGRVLDVGAADADGVAAFAATGAALAGLHAAPPRRLPPAIDDESAALRRAADAVGALLPGLRARAGSLAAALVRRLPDDATATIHGDFSPDQVLVDGGDIAVCDLDAVARGNPAVDLGHFAASLDAAVVAGRLSAERRDAALQAVLSGYAGAGGRIPGPSLAVCRAASLVRLASEPFRLRDPGWPQATQALLERAEVIGSAALRGRRADRTVTVP